MQPFLREYAARSILPHLNTVNADYRLYKNNYNNDNNNTGSSSDNSFYYIAPLQQLLLSSGNSSAEDTQDAYSNSSRGGSGGGSGSGDGNNSSAVLMLASLGDGYTASSTAHPYNSAADVAYHPLLLGAADASINGTFYEGFRNFVNFSCDGESLSASVLSSNATEAEEESALSSVYFKTAVYLLYIPIFIFALLGNGTVCYIVQSTPRMRTVTNYFIANLAVGDILMSLFCVPFSFVSIFILGYWPFGIVLCYLVNYSQAVSVLVSAYTLVAISIDRYMAIMWPLRPRIAKRYAKFIIAGVWGIALATALPIPIVSQLWQPDVWHEQCNRYICREEWPTNEQYYYYTLALFTLQFVVPLAVLIFTYTRIALAVWGKRPPGEAENSRDQRMARSKRKMIKMMVMVVIVFTICWLPFNILVLLLNDEEFKLWEPLPYFWFAFHWLAMSHSCYNPIIYCYMNARFRGGFLQIIYRVPGLRRCCCLRRYLRSRGDRSYEATGTDDAFHLQRVNTCTTYISTRRKMRTNSVQASQFSCAETTVLR